MHLTLTGQIKDLTEAFSGICNFINLSCGGNLDVSFGGDGIDLSFDGSNYRLIAKDKSCFFRALSYIKENEANHSPWTVKETMKMKTLGAMFDCSRNGVYTVAAVKKYLSHLALMGYNMLMLYTEDTYEIPGEPYFGHLRGRYSLKDLKELDDFAYNLGIELVPCIQTLAHLKKMLQWPVYHSLRDTHEILLSADDKVIEFLDKAIGAVSSAVRSKRIHIGMDEAHDVGLGRYKKLHGERNRFDILCDHLSRVSELLDKRGLSGMMWSDMFFRLAAGEYATDKPIPPEVIARIPANMQMVYWDYYNSNPDDYVTNCKRHARLERETIFATGVWTWNGLMVNQSKAFSVVIAGFEGTSKSGIKEIISTLWGDNGGETNLFGALPGLCLLAELTFGKALTYDNAVEVISSRFNACTGDDLPSYMILGEIDNMQKNDPLNLRTVQASKQLLYQDPAYGMFDRHFESLNCEKHFASVADKLEHCKGYTGPYSTIFRSAAALCRVLEKKAMLARDLRVVYANKDMAALTRYADVYMPELTARFETLCDAFYRDWAETRSPFGFEVFECRLGGTLARVKTLTRRISDYTRGVLPSLPELEIEPLFFDSRSEAGEFPLTWNHHYHSIFTACEVLF